MATVRTASITVNVTGLDPIVVTVTQAGAAPTLVVDPSNIDVANSSGNVTFDVTSNGNWTVQSPAEWCTVTPSGTGDGEVSVDYLENTWAEPRTASLTIQVDGLDPIVVTVSQAAAEAHLTSDPQLIQVSADADEAQMLVYTNMDWTASSNSAWATVPAGASGDAAIMITYEENTGLTPRSAEITITGNGGLNATTVLEQAGAEAMVSVNPGNVNVMYQAGNVSFDIISNTDWTASADSSWLTVTPSGSLSGTLVANYLQNPYYAERVSTISVVIPGKEPQKVTVTQSSSEVSVEEIEAAGNQDFPESFERNVCTGSG